MAHFRHVLHFGWNFETKGIAVGQKIKPNPANQFKNTSPNVISV